MVKRGEIEHASVELNVLGEVAANIGGEPRRITAKRQRGVLAYLALHAGEPVSADRVLDAVWGDNLPASGVKAVAFHISNLRTVLEPNREGEGSLIRTSPAGYTLCVDSAQVDAHRFQQLIGESRDLLRGDAETSLDRVQSALELWRGNPFADLGDEPFVASESRSLEQLRLLARRTQAEARISLGHHEEAIADTEALIAELPLEEAGVRLLMTALHRVGRTVDALGAFSELRLRLSTELGIEPSKELQRLEQQLLDGGLDDPSESSANGPSVAVLPSGLITFLATDLSGIAALWEVSADAGAELLDRHDEVLAAAVTDHDGTLLTGQGAESTLSVFARASDAARAAMQTRSALDALFVEAEIDLQVRMAAHTGEAAERNGTFFGRTVNRVTRLREVADAGDILISRATADLITDAVPEAQLVHLGQRELRDLDRPETVYLLADATDAAPERDEARQTPLASLPLPGRLRSAGSKPMVGRATELAVLDGLSAESANEVARFVVLHGDAGIGKSRLAAEAAVHAKEEGALVLFGRCDEFSTSPFGPFVEALRFVTDRLPTEQISRLFDEHVAVLARLLPELDVASDETGHNAESERERLFGAVAASLESLSADTPIVLVVEDLHWADQATLSMLRHVLLCPMERVLILATTRPSDDGRPALSHIDVDAHQLAFEFHQVDLHGLDIDATASLIEGVDAIIGGDGASRVFALTAGNPLLTLGIASAVLDDDRRGIASDLPVSIQAILDRQLDQIGDEHLPFFEAAAILGPTFEVDLAAQLCGMAFADVELALDTAERRHIVHEEAAGTLHLYAFNHGLFQARLAARSSSIRRRGLHARTARLVRDTPSVDGDRHARVASHALAAGGVLDPIEAIDAFRTAAREAGQRTALDAAIEWLRHANDLAASIDPDGLGFDVTIELGTAMSRAAQAGSRKLLDGAAEQAIAAGDANRAVRALFAADIGSHGLYAFVDDRRVAQIRWALEARPSSDDPERALLLAALATELTHDLEDDERFDLVDEALEMAERMEDPDVLVAIYEIRIRLLSGPKHARLQLADSTRLLALLKSQEAPAYRRLVWLGYQSQASQRLGDASTGLKCLAEMDDIAATESLLPRQHVFHEMIRGGWHIMTGSLSSAEASIRSAFRQTRKSDANDPDVPMSGAATARQMLAVRFWQGRAEGMLDLISAGAKVSPMMRPHYAYWLLQTGRRDEAAAVWADCADEPTPKHWESTNWVAPVFLETAAVAASFETSDRCRYFYDKLEPFADVLINPYSADMPTHHYLGLLARSIGDVDRELHHHEASAQFARRAGAPLMEGRSCLELARWHNEHGDPRAATRRNATALRMGREFEAPWLVRHAEEMSEQIART